MDSATKQKLWKTADQLRSNMDAAEYKHVVLGLIFLKYISDSFDTAQDKMRQEAYYKENPQFIEQDLKGYCEANLVFWVPPTARWEYLRNNARQAEIGKLIDDAMLSIEQENKPLKNILNKNYARLSLPAGKLADLIDTVSTIGFGEDKTTARDTLGEVYEYFLGMFADAEGKRGGQFYTAASVVKTMVAIMAPHRGRVYDPCCGSGGMFVQSEKFIKAHQGNTQDISIYGQESNPTTWRLAAMNLAIRGIGFNLGRYAADTFHEDQHPNLKADYILANPPFNVSDWGGEKLQSDPRWQYGIPPVGNANYAWIEHMLYHLAPTGVMGTVLANGSMSSNTGGEGDIRQKLVDKDLVECMVALPGQLFFNTQIPVCLWFLRRAKARKGEVLFIDARNLGFMADRTRREFTDDDINKIAHTYHAWRGDSDAPKGLVYENVKGFCKAAALADIAANDYVLTPGRYVGVAEVEEDDEAFAAKMARLTADLSAQMAQSAALDEQIKQNLEKLGWK